MKDFEPECGPDGCAILVSPMPRKRLPRVQVIERAEMHLMTFTMC